MPRWWISWEDNGVDSRPFKLPLPAEIASWWCTGYGVDYSTVCAVVDAGSDAEAKIVVKKFWDVRDWRFCSQKPNGWMPDPGRFPKETVEGAP
jgi:hypothetical protein